MAQRASRLRNWARRPRPDATRVESYASQGAVSAFRQVGQVDFDEILKFEKEKGDQVNKRVLATWGAGILLGMPLGLAVVTVLGTTWTVVAGIGGAIAVNKFLSN